MVFRHSICNEAFDKWPFADACKAIRGAGYSGIEIAPFTLAETPGEVSAAQRAECRDIIGSEGLAFVGLHWLMVSPKGLHVTGPDVDLRRRSWDHIRALIDLCADLGPNGVLVFGSPNQRKTTGGMFGSFCRRVATIPLISRKPSPRGTSDNRNPSSYGSTAMSLMWQATV